MIDADNDDADHDDHDDDNNDDADHADHDDHDDHDDDTDADDDDDQDAIGCGICEELLESGCAVAVTDLPGDPFDKLVQDLESRFTGAGVVMGVTSPASVREAFRQVILRWGGVDLVVPNAGAALVSSLVSMDPQSFRRLELINTEGTLHVLAEAGRRFKHQGTGGDIVVSEDFGDTWSKAVSNLGPISKGDHYVGVTAAIA